MADVTSMARRWQWAGLPPSSTGAPFRSFVPVAAVATVTASVPPAGAGG